MYDIGIIGAGPAGAVLAERLGERFKVLLLDSGRTKCCGGILAPEAQRMLGKLDLAIPKSVLVNPQPFAVVVLDIKTRLIRHYARQYVNIDRNLFNRWLVSLVPQTVDIRSNAVYRFSEPKNNETVIHFIEKNEEQTESVRYLIGADGAFSAIRREFFPQHPFPNRYIALQDWFDRNAVKAVNERIDFWSDYVGIFDTEFTDFYAWTIPKNDTLIVGGATPFTGNSRQRFEELKRRLEPFGLCLGSPNRREAAQIFRPFSSASICLGSQNVFLVGEAAGLISPSSAEGISFALASADIFADAMFESKENPLHQYRRRIQPLLRDIWLKNCFKNPAMFNPCIRKYIMKSGLTALD